MPLPRIKIFFAVIMMRVIVSDYHAMVIQLERLSIFQNMVKGEKESPLSSLFPIF